MQQKRFVKEVEVTAGIVTAPTSCMLSIRSSYAVAIAVMVLTQVLSVRATILVMHTATVRSVWCWRLNFQGNF